MRVIPVIDIMQGKVVHAIKGYREEYRPLKSQILETQDPIEVALELKRRFGFDELYVADLDGIMKNEVNLSVLCNICKTGYLKVMVDAGVTNPVKAQALLSVGVAGIVVGTETLEHLEDLSRIVKLSGNIPIIGSIDVKDGKVLSKCKELSGVSPPEVAKLLKDCGVEQIVLLDISRVGSESGVKIGVAQSILNKVSLPLLVGGSVSSLKDIFALRGIGASGVLVATVLHNTQLNKRDIDFVRNVKKNFSI
ncbi:MAG: HisA/HisF-related TIM barrel protein [Nitrososphaerales archaeon]|nr:HisA/HisF-related TIM barrel protein [Nitrososphaerales archaeon]